MSSEKNTLNNVEQSASQSAWYTSPPRMDSHVGALAREESKRPDQRSYVDIYNEYNSYAPPTPEALERERKRKRSSAIISALGDGLSALSNLYHTTQYAPNVDQSRLQLSARNQAMYDKIRAGREAREREWYKGYERSLALDRADRDRDRNWRLQLAGHLDQRNDRHRAEQAEADRFNMTFNYQKDRDDRNFNEGVRQSDRNYDLQKSAHAHNMAMEKARELRANAGHNMDMKIKTKQLNGSGNSQGDRVFRFNDGSTLVVNDQHDRGALSIMYGKLPQEQQTSSNEEMEAILQSMPGASQEDRKAIQSEVMIDAISRHAYENPKFQNEMRKIMGQSQPPLSLSAHLARTGKRLFDDEPKKTQGKKLGI